jgi:hypothetical protein
MGFGGYRAWTMLYALEVHVALVAFSFLFTWMALGLSMSNLEAHGAGGIADVGWWALWDWMMGR